MKRLEPLFSLPPQLGGEGLGGGAGLGFGSAEEAASRMPGLCSSRGAWRAGTGRTGNLLREWVMSSTQPAGRHSWHSCLPALPAWAAPRSLRHPGAGSEGNPKASKKLSSPSRNPEPRLRFGPTAWICLCQAAWLWHSLPPDPFCQMKQTPWELSNRGWEVQLQGSLLWTP